MNKIIYITIIAIIILGIGWFVLKGSNTNAEPVETISPEAMEDEKETSKIEPLEFTEEQLESYYSSYSNPYVVHVRKALDGYLDGSNFGMDSPESVIEPDIEMEGAVYGLASFDNEYYMSKFMVYAINNSIVGGKEISIIFQDKPDKLFTAWVYEFEGEGYDLRGFWQNLSYDEEKMVEIQQLYKNQLADKEHAI